MRYLFGFRCVCALGVLSLVGCNDAQGAGALVVRICERAIDCNPEARPPRTVEGCVDSITPRMQCLSPSETADFIAELEACLAAPCRGWSLTCPPGLPPCPTDTDCVAPLSDYCAGSECPTYSEAVAEAECDGYWEVGTCGDFLHVWHRWGFGDHSVEYFDASGALVASEVWADYNAYCDGTSFSIFFGPVPDCQREATLLRPEDCYQANSYCASNCPLQDREECVQQYLSTGSCGNGGTGGNGG